MLVFHQKSIVESLKTHLSVKDSLAYQPLLEWVLFWSFFVFMLCLPVTHISTFQLPVDVIASLTPVSMCLLSPSLVVQLARDLQTDFYPHFSDFFILITSLLDTKDTELLEWAFTCLSYLYKYLWRLMVKDMSNIYRWKMKERSHHCSIDFSKLNFTPTVYTARFWHTRRSTSASLQQRVFRFWWGR